MISSHTYGDYNVYLMNGFSFSSVGVLHLLFEIPEGKTVNMKNSLFHFYEHGTNGLDPKTKYVGHNITYGYLADFSELERYVYSLKRKMYNALENRSPSKRRRARRRKCKC